MGWAEKFKHSFIRKDDIQSNKLKDLDLPVMMNDLIEHFPDAVCLFDFKGDLISSNINFLDMFGYTVQDSQLTLNQIFQHFDFEQAMNEQSQKAQDVLIIKDGKRLSVSITHVPLIVDGDIFGSFCMIRPHEEPLTHAQSYTAQKAVKYMQSILNRLDIAIWSVNSTQQKIMFVSDAIENIFDMPKKEVTLETWKIIAHPDDLDYVLKEHSRLLTEDKIHLQYRIVTPKGKTKWVHERTIVVRSSQNQIIRVLGSLVDITSQMQLQHKLEHIAYFDDLTQLPNRLKGRETLKQKIGEYQLNHRSFALFYINLDGFDRINETFGYEIGDEVIKQMCNRIQHFMKDYGFLCRLTGDELMALVDHKKNIIEIHQIAQSLIDVVKHPLQIKGYDIYLTASIGISQFPTDGQGNKELVKHARTALRLSKQFGRGNFQIYSSAMNIETFRSFQLENDLRQALETQALYLEYQPKVNVRTLKATGAEALIRWKHPVWGNISPAEFIPVAEACTLIQEIGDFVLKNVFQQVGEWEAIGVPFQSISFNLSAKNLFKNDLVDRIEFYIKKYSVSPSRLEIEITEGVLLMDTSVVVRQISKLKELGIKISLDDYGTGYSSIHYLKQYPIDTLKIDRSFIQNVAQDNEDTVIVQSIVDLARGLNKKVIAEGVERLDQFDMLKRMGVDKVQGYLFSKAVSPVQMKQLFLLDTLQPKVNN